MRLAVCTYSVEDWKVFLWDQGRTDDFHLIDRAIKKYRDIRIFSDTKRMFVVSPRVNLMPDVDRFFDFDHSYFLADIAPCYLKVSVNDADVGCRVYADEPQFEIGVRNPDGFGVIPKPGLDAELAAKLFHKKTVDAIHAFLAKNAKVSYA